MAPYLIFEDEHLLVVNKPAGLNTHAPSPYAGEGLYDWLRNREARWANLAIIHRLDKETSGVLVFSKTPLANRSLTEQFTQHRIRKKYLLLTDRSVPEGQFTVKSTLVRAGDRYVSRPSHAGGERAETQFRLLPKTDLGRMDSAGSTLSPCPRGAAFMPLQRPSAAGGRSGMNAAPRGHCLVEAQPLTGRTHQIRVQAAERGFPILGDVLYGGTPANRVYLHAAELVLRHPFRGEEMTFRATAEFNRDARLGLRAGLIDAEETDVYRVVHGASDGWPGWYVERLGAYLLSQSEQPLSAPQRLELERLMELLSVRGAYHKLLRRRVRKAVTSETSPQLTLGDAAPERFSARENGLQFELSFNEGYSVGLFLDQRDNRRRFLTGAVAAGFPLASPLSGPLSKVAEFDKGFDKGLDKGCRCHPDSVAMPLTPPFRFLNTFAYTCGFSVCAAKAGAHTTSLDLSRKYLEWGKRNFVLNGLEPGEHDFIYGDVFDWLRRLEKKGCFFDAIALDPPTFSQSKESGVFRAAKDYGRLASAALRLLAPGGVLFASTNAAEWLAEEFLNELETTIHAAKRESMEKHYIPQPTDFPISRSEPAYLKTVWLRIA